MNIDARWIEDRFRIRMGEGISHLVAATGIGGVGKISGEQWWRLIWQALLQVWADSDYAEEPRHVVHWSSPLYEGERIMQVRVMFPPMPEVDDASEAVLPTVSLPMSLLARGCSVAALFKAAGLCASLGEARRLIAGGGARMDGVPMRDADLDLFADDIPGGAAKLSAGKKRHVFIQLMYMKEAEDVTA